MSSIDYSKYSVYELLDAKNNIDPEAYPENYNVLLKELDSRKGEIQQLQAETQATEFKIAEKRVKLIGYLQIIASIVLVGYIFTGYLSGAVSIIIAFFFITLNACAGYFAIKEKVSMYWLTVVNQTLQLVSFAIGKMYMGYSGIGGVYLTLSWGKDFYFGINANINPGFYFQKFTENLPITEISIDILAIIYIVAVLTVYGKSDAKVK
ncbi:hypothetical protein [Kangiella sp. HZ709]|uniref:hypothetical protein n=1 Tax=Kangiella sp. HZ709 TaxID=2666328 RepID=UPI0012B06288|nr:hypothetical protein [Kangiella sp. HZ709]MRX28421.1 hypothetical protein [Kangiella sp. HZ709]